MVPLIVFLAIWGILIFGFSLLMLITSYMSLRFGISGFMTAATNTAFISVTILVLAATSWYLIGVDWSQSVSLIPSNLPGLIP